MSFKDAIEFLNNNTSFKMLDQGDSGKFPYQQCPYIDVESLDHDITLRFFFNKDTNKLFTKMNIS